MRAGGRALSLLSVPLNVLVLQALADEPSSLIDLRRAVESPPQTTMRAHLRVLTETGVLRRSQQDGFPGPVEYSLLPAGRDLLELARFADQWLTFSQEEDRGLGSGAAKSVLKALGDAWEAGIMRGLAARPLSLTDMSKLISALNYPSLERRLAALRLAGLVQAEPVAKRGTPYAPSDSMRASVGLLTACAAWERRHLGGAVTPFGRIDVETCFLLAIPLLELPRELDGFCRLIAEVPAEGSRRLAGSMVRVSGGSIESCVSRLEGNAAGWAAGPVHAWFAAVIEDEKAGLEIGGDSLLATALVDALHVALFKGVRGQLA